PLPPILAPPPNPAPAPSQTTDPNILALESLLNQNSRSSLSTTTVVAPTLLQTILQTNNRDVIASPANAPIAVDTEVGGANPALGLSEPTSVRGLQFADNAGPDEFFLDADLLPVTTARSRSGGDGGGMDKILWPAAALLSFSEGGVW